MDNNLIKKLETLKDITPETDFAASTRRLVLSIEPQRSHLPLAVGGVGFALAVLVVLSWNLVSTSPPTVSSSLNSEFLKDEFNELGINTQIKEITYRQDINQTISSALTEISSIHLSHLNPSVLKSEEELINKLGEEGKLSEIDILLEKIIF